MGEGRHRVLIPEEQEASLLCRGEKAKGETKITSSRSLGIWTTKRKGRMMKTMEGGNMGANTFAVRLDIAATETPEQRGACSSAATGERQAEAMCRNC